MIKRTLIFAAIALAILLPIKYRLVETFVLDNTYMSPTLQRGKIYLIDRVTLKLRAPKRGDIVVVRSPIGEAGYQALRVIGLPGERVDIREKKVYINDSYHEEGMYVKRKNQLGTFESDNVPPRVVPEGNLYVMGDNRDESKDSSNWKDATGQRVYYVPMQNVSGILRGAF